MIIKTDTKVWLLDEFPRVARWDVHPNMAPPLRRVVFPRPAVGPQGAEACSRRDVPARRDSILRKAWGFLEVWHVWHPIYGSTCSTCGSGPTRLVIVLSQLL